MPNYLGKRPKIVWGDAFENTLQFGYPLDDVITYPVPRDGFDNVQGKSGVEDGWDAGDDQMLEGTGRWIPLDDGTTDEGNPTTGWNGAAGVAAFLTWARKKKAFRFYPDAAVGSSAGPTPTFQAAGALAAGVAAVNPLWPTHQAGDIGVLVIIAANQAIATPNGWTAVVNGAQGTGVAGAAGAINVAVFWRRATSSNEAGPYVANPGDHVAAAILTVRSGASLGTPVNASAGDTGASSTAVSVPSITTTIDNALVLAIATHALDVATAQFSGWTNAALTGLAEQFDAATTQGVGGGIGVATGGKSAAGATGATTATLASASAQARVALAIAPDPTFYTMYLVEPMTDPPEREDNAIHRRARLAMRTTDGSAVLGY